MPLAYDLTTTLIDASIASDTMTLSGSYASPYGGSQGVYEISGTLQAIINDVTLVQGSWPGTVINYVGAAVIETGGTWQTGSWWGSDATWGTNGPPVEDHDTTLLPSDEHPTVVEGINLGEYNVFPYPAVVTTTTKVSSHDAARFQKSYSFSRFQPVRVRVVKR